MVYKNDCLGPKTCKITSYDKYEIGENRKTIQNTTMVNDSLVCVLHNFYVDNIVCDVSVEIDNVAQQIVEWRGRNG